MYRCKSLYASLLGFALDGTEQMDPREVFELWVRDLLPELQVFYSVVLTQHSMFVCALMTYQGCNDRPLFLLSFLGMQLQVPITLYVVIICEICIWLLARCELCHNDNTVERSAPFIDLTPGFNNIQEAVNEYFSEETVMDYECQV